MPSPLEQRVEALERQLADMQAMLESLLDYVQRQSADFIYRSQFSNNCGNSENIEK